MAGSQREVENQLRKKTRLDWDFFKKMRSERPYKKGWKEGTGPGMHTWCRAPVGTPPGRQSAERQAAGEEHRSQVTGHREVLKRRLMINPINPINPIGLSQLIQIEALYSGQMTRCNTEPRANQLSSVSSPCRKQLSGWKSQPKQDN